MRGLLCKFKIEQEKARSRVATLFAKWRVLLYSAPVLALFAPTIAFADNKVPIPKTGGAAGKVLGVVGNGAVALGGAALSGIGTAVAAGFETLGSLMVWLFILFHVSKIFADLFSGIFLFLINFLIGVSQYNSFLGANIVTIGWTVTRDIANMFLVVALLVIAFATILNINSYQASSLLKEFFFAAILVNFSKMICGLFIDAAQVVMMTFVSGYAETAAGNFIRLFKVADWLQLALGTAKDQTTGQGIGVQTLGASVVVGSAEAIGSVAFAAGNFFTGITSNVLTAIIAFIGVLAVLSLDIILVVRIVTIWFLIVASPIAFVAKVLPVTKGFASQWWGAFMKQLIAGPLVAFIVWISLASIAVSDSAFDVTKEARQSSAQLFAEASATQTSQGQLAATKISQWENLALYFIPIVIFIMGAKWAVGVAGGAAKSITGFANKKLGGYARSGLSAFKKQAIGKGQFSVMSQAKKGFTGEGGFTTGLAGGALGYASTKVLGDKLGKKVNYWGGRFTGGESGRAETRRLHKQVAHNIGAPLGLGEEGHKRHEVGNANADAEMYRAEASKQLTKDNAAAKLLTGKDREDAEEAAQAKFASTQKKADEALEHVAEAQKDLFKRAGLSSDVALVAAMKEKVKKGTVTESELNVAKKIVTEAADRKINDEVAKKRREHAVENDAKVKAGLLDPEDVPKFDENQIRGRAEEKYGKPKDEIKKLADHYQTHEFGLNEHSATTPLQREKDEAFEKEDKARPILQQATLNVANTYSTQLAAGNVPAARANLAAGTGAALHVNKKAGASDAELSAVAGRALASMPVLERDSFADNMKAAAPDPALATMIDGLRVKLRAIERDGKKAMDTIADRWNKRDHKAGDNGLYSYRDLGSIRDSNQRQTFSPEALAELAAAIAHDPKMVTRLSPEVISHPDVQRVVGSSVNSGNAMIDVMNEISATVDKSIRKQMAKNIATALRQNSADPAVRANADGYAALV